MISEVKNVLVEVLKGFDIPPESIAKTAREEQQLITQEASLPIVSLISDPGRFEDADYKEIRLVFSGETLYRQVRTKRVMPVVVKVTAENEEQAGGLLSRIIGSLPLSWLYQGVKGDVEPTREKYSDCDSKMNSRYEAAVVVEFGVDVGPIGTKAQRIGGIDGGEGKHETR